MTNSDTVCYQSKWERSNPENASWYEIIMNEELRTKLKGNVLFWGNNSELSIDLYQELNKLSEINLKKIKSQLTRERKQESLDQLVEQFVRQNWLPDKIIYLCPPYDWQNSTNNFADYLQDNVYPLFYLNRSLLKHKPEKEIQYICLSNSLSNKELKFSNPFFAAINGMARSIHLEYPKFNYKLIEVNNIRNSRIKLSDLLLYELTEENGVNEILYAGLQRYEKDWEEFELDQVADDGRQLESIKTDGVYLITGGTGGLGKILATHLAKKSKPNLVLVGRSSMSAEIKNFIEKLNSLGSKAIYVQADISNQSEAKKAINKCKGNFNNINGIFHCAGVKQDSYLVDKQPNDIKKVIAPKVPGLIHLDDASKEEELDFFISFSSISAVMGNVGQSDYAYANSFMDNFSRLREELRAKGKRSGKSLSINWPLWEEGGMKLDEQNVEFLSNYLGLTPLDTETGLKVLDKGLSHPQSQFMVLNGDYQKLKEKKWLKSRQSKIKDKQEYNDKEEAIDSKNNEILKEFQTDILNLLAKILEMSVEEINLEDNLENLGLTSVVFVELTNLINEKYGLEILPAIFFEHATPQSIISSLFSNHKAKIKDYYRDKSNFKEQEEKNKREEYQQAEDQQKDFSKPEEKENNKDKGITNQVKREKEPVAIIGMSGFLPQSKNLSTFWKNLIEGNDLVTEISEKRWKALGNKNIKPSNPESICAKWGGFLEDIDKFDAKFFNISSREAELMDPQQRIFLETFWQTVEDAGYRISDLEGTKTGVYVGVANSDYYDVIRDSNKQPEAHVPTGIEHSILANRISYIFDLRGPSEPVNTACSSSLIAVDRAVKDLRTGSCNSAVVGGVNIINSSTYYKSLSEAGMLSQEGCCKTFDKEASGYVRGEGSGAIFLKPLDEALKDGDNIYALISGTAINHGGRANTLTSPNVKAQKEVLIDAYEDAQIDPTTVSYIEAHGTGTELGDPIEIDALKDAFDELYKRKGQALSRQSQIGIGAVKTNIGHLESAAGIAGMIKVLLAMKHKKIPPNINFKELNPHIQLEDTPFYLVTEDEEWSKISDTHNNSLPRRAGVSSFGFGGANAHIVLEEYEQQLVLPEIEADRPQLILLSAKNDDRLQKYAKRMVTYLEDIYQSEEALSLNLPDIAYTLQVGREPMEKRLALIVSDIPELINKLKKYYREDDEFKNLYTNYADQKESDFNLLLEGKAGDEFMNTVMENRDLDKIAKLWMRGVEINWQALYQHQPTRISLPTYPFEREEYWIDQSPDDNKQFLKSSEVNDNKQFAKNSEVNDDKQFLNEVEFEADQPSLTKDSNLQENKEETGEIKPNLTETSIEKIKKKVKQKTADVLYMDSSELAEDEAFANLGIDSILGVELIKKINQLFNINLKATELYNYENINRLSTYIETQLDSEKEASNEQKSNTKDSNQESINKEKDTENSTPEDSQSKAAQSLAQQPSKSKAKEKISLKKAPNIRENYPEEKEKEIPKEESPTDIAVIGMSGRFPQAKNLEQFWNNLSQGRDCITEVAPERWNPNLHFDPDPKAENKTYCKWGGFIKDYEKFDPLFFKISPKEARVMDPQQRLLLEETWKTIEDSGYSLEKFPQEECGVFIGAAPGDYTQPHLSANKTLNAHTLFGSSNSILTGRLSYTFNLQGPNMAIDTACSSSLVAIHQACQSLVNEECQVAIAGGVNIITTPAIYIMTSKAEMLSKEGRCKTFSDNADGFVPGEAVGVVALKRLPEALADNDNIYAVIKGSGINQDGQTNGITAPNGNAQKKLMNKVYDQVNIAPEKIDYIEAHGTGTNLGDPIEVDALTEVFRKYTDKKQCCALGSVKTNIGHGLAAAGISGFIKTVLCLSHNKLVPSLNFDKPNEHINFAESPFYVNTDLKDWDKSEKEPRKAAVSSFGFSGTNAHLVLEEAPVGENKTSHKSQFGKDSCLFVLSAKNEEQLKEYADKFVNYLKDDKFAAVSLVDLVYTLQVGRESMEERLATVVANKQQLLEKLKKYTSGQEDIKKFYCSNIQENKMQQDLLRGREGKEYYRTIIEEKKYEKIAQLWVSGFEVDWTVLYAGEHPNRVSLPTYPFNRKEYKRSEDYSQKTSSIKKNKEKNEQLLSNEVASEVVKTQNDRETKEKKLSDEWLISERVKEVFASTLEVDQTVIDSDTPYTEYGIDSILATELVDNINQELKINLWTTDLFNYSTINKLTSHIIEEYETEINFKSDKEEVVSSTAANTTVKTEKNGEEKVEESNNPVLQNNKANKSGLNNQASSQEIAIIGMSGRFPEAQNTDQYWENLVNGRDSIYEITRWDTDKFYDPDPEKRGKTYNKWGGCLSDIDKFDPLFFNISPKEAEWMDPQHRLFLEQSWNALEDAGYSKRKLDGKKCGVFVGFNYSDYYIMGSNLMGDYNGLLPDTYSLTGNDSAVLAARIAYFLNLKGPSITVSTACSSSIVATHLGCESLLSGTSDIAIAGGVQILHTPECHITASRLGLLSADDKCKAFDNDADGFVSGEAVGAVVLKRLDKALEDGNHIYGVIAGSGINQDGKTTGITAPSAPSQMELEKEVYANYDINPETISYVEAHGTGTKIGDPIEVEALTKSFRGYTDKKQFCAIGSVKTNIGHSMAAAGIASLIKVLLCMEHQKLVPSLNLEQENEMIDFENTPFYVNTQVQDWQPDDMLRKAAINAFGFSGTNAHMVVRESSVQKQNRKAVESSKPCYLIPVSAKTETALNKRLRDLADWLKEEGQNQELKDISYTLFVGRTQFSLRVALIAKTTDELKNKLRNILQDNDKEGGLINTEKGKRFKKDTNLKKRGNELIEQLGEPRCNKTEYQDKLLELAELYIKRYQLNWKDLYKGEKYYYISMPTYPFERESYWLPETKQKNTSTKLIARDNRVDKLHPLLDDNKSKFNEQKFTLELTGNEFYLKDHKINGQIILPGVVYLEMARAAGARSTERKLEKITDVNWLNPLIFSNSSKGKEIEINLYQKQGEEATFKVCSPAREEKKIYAQGKLVYQKEKRTSKDSSISIENIKQRATNQMKGKECYDLFQNLEFHFGQTSQPIQKLYISEDEVLSYLQLPQECRKNFEKFTLHPSLLDGALQTVIGFWSNLELDSKPSDLIPASLGEVIIRRSLTENCYTYITWSSREEEIEKNRKIDIKLLNERGQLLVELNRVGANVQSKNEDSRLKNMLKELSAGELDIDDVENFLEVRE